MSNVTVNKGTTDFNRKDSHGYTRIGQSERMVSMLAGTTLASSAMRSRSLLSAALMLGVSAGLLHRGATGKCGFSKIMGQANNMLNNGCEQISQRTGNSDDSKGSGNSGRSDNRSNSSGSSQNKRIDEVKQAGKDSFPASDPPSFTPVTGEAGRAGSHMNK